jgi:Zn finger protein HypA/HybF involved in hydrogenase expression
MARYEVFYWECPACERKVEAEVHEARRCGHCGDCFKREDIELKSALLRVLEVRGSVIITESLDAEGE